MRERLARTGDFHALPLFNPAGHLGKLIAEVTNGCGFHRETTMSHKPNHVKPAEVFPALYFSPARMI